MSFQAYIDNIKAKTGKGPEEFKKLAEKKGFVENGGLRPSVKAAEIIQWLKQDFKLGHGHAMAIYAVFKKIKPTLEIKEKNNFTDKKIKKINLQERLFLGKLTFGRFSICELHYESLVW